MMTAPIRLRYRNRRGAVLIEFVMISAILMMSIIGVMEFGRAVWTRNSLGHAAREAARWAIVRGNESGRVADTAAVSAFVLSKIGTRPLSINTVWSPNKDPGSTVTVTVQHQFRAVVPIVPQVMLSSRSRMVISF
jgi:Flp pilus assembly protein TadG